MIEYLTKNRVSAILFSLVILSASQLIIGDFSTTALTFLSLLFLQGLIFDYLCFRFSILGQKSNMPLVLFSAISILVLSSLSFGIIIYGFVWLAAFFLAFESGDNNSQSNNYIIYIGIILGIAQTINNISILLMLPVFILFLQTGARNALGFLQSILYFFMVIFSYAGVLFVMEIEDKIYDLIPRLTFDYSAFNTILIKLFVPFLVASLVLHFLQLNSYKFRYPNKSKILNYTLLVQLILAVLLVLITAQAGLIIYFVLPSALLLSFLFVYKSENTFANAAFASLIVLALASLWLYQYLIL